MTFRTLIRRSLRFHWRSHAGVVIGAAIGSAALVGALVVGDSVKGSLRAKALERLAGTWIAMETGDRFFQGPVVASLRGERYAVPVHQVSHRVASPGIAVMLRI